MTKSVREYVAGRKIQVLARSFGTTLGSHHMIRCFEWPRDSALPGEVYLCQDAGMNDAENDPDAPNNSEILRLLKEAIAHRRGYADFFEWPDRTQVELEIARRVCKYLTERGKLQPNGILSVVADDPPDAVYTLPGGSIVAIEVTELVSEAAVKRARHLKEMGQPIEVIANWNPAPVAEELSKRIARKDRKVAKAARSYDEMVLAVFTDETMITEACAREALERLAFQTFAIDRALFVMSYQPDSDYPGSYPVLPIPIVRA